MKMNLLLCVLPETKNNVLWFLKREIKEYII